MTNPTTNFGWVMPSPTDLVTDLPADFEVFGQAVDTDFVDLLGGANGYILSKASATDLDFAWIPNDQGDITAVNVTAPITGGGTAGAVTIGINAATTSVVGAVQLSDSTSTTSSVLASTPTATKAAYDLANTANTAAGAAQTTANNAIAKSTVTTAGDIIYRNATVPARLGIGTVGQVLTVNSGATAPEWTTIASGTTLTGCSLTRTTDLTVSDSTWTTVGYNTENWDTNTFHDNSTNNSRITIPSGKGGKYEIFVNIIFANNTTGERQIRLLKNGSETLRTYGLKPNGTSSYLLFTNESLIATDYIEIQIFQSSGGNLVAYFNGFYNYFGVNYLGA